LEKEKVEYFKNLLLSELNRLLTDAEITISSMGDGKENFPDPTDRAALETNRNLDIRIREREHKLIGKIKEAIKRIEDESFGICELCGEEISYDRLKARPVTTLCIDCKKRQENREKKLGI